MKRQPTEWEKIFANEGTDKGFFKIYKHPLQLNHKKKTNPKQNHDQFMISLENLENTEMYKGKKTPTIIAQYRNKSS